MFTNEQVAALKAPLTRDHIKRNPKGFDYVEGWHAIAEANRIFGFGGWDRQTLEMRQLGEPELVGNNWRVAYHCRVRITVRTDNFEIIRDGSGYGSGIVKDIRDAHESAIKEAETDAMKRALMTFGNPFGLALYDKEQANVADKPEPQRDVEAAQAYLRVAKNVVRNFGTAQNLLAWWKDEGPHRVESGVVQGTPEYEELFVYVKEMGEALKQKDAA